MGEAVMLGFSGESSPLTFVRYHADGSKDFWVPVRTGDYATDTAKGKEYAREFKDYIVETRNPAIYKSICQSMFDHGLMGAVEIGFCMEIGVFLAGMPA